MKLGGVMGMGDVSPEKENSPKTEAETPVFLENGKHEAVQLKERGVRVHV